MDPDEALKRCRELAKRVEDATYAEECEVAGLDLAEQFKALDEWLSKGGFAPREWPLVSMGK